MNREEKCLYWITKHAPRQSCWLIVAKLGDMLGHNNTTIHHPSMEAVADLSTQPTTVADLLTHDDLEYIYASKMDDNRITILISDMTRYYVIDNKLITEEYEETEESENQEEQKSEANKEKDQFSSDIWYNESIIELLDIIPGTVRKRLSLKQAHKQKLKTNNIDTNLIQPMHFSRKTFEQQVELWKQYVKQQTRDKGDTLDFSGLYKLDPKVIVAAGLKYPTFKTVVINQNNKFTNLHWLFYFPNLEVLSVWYINMLKDESFKDIHRYAPKINTLELHMCPQVTGRVLLNFNGLGLLKNLILNNPKCSLQENIHETIISDKEWETIKGNCLNTLLIDSGNLTRDFIKFALESYPNLEHFIMHKEVMLQLKEHSSSGHSDDKIVFHSAEDTKQGFHRYKDVKIYELVRNKAGNMFSESMLNKIKQNDPSKSGAVDELLSNLK